MQAEKLNNITLSDWLSYSPYDFNRSLRRYLDINDFKEIRTTPESYYSELEKLRKALDPKSNLFKRFYIVSGYSGSGKTTFVHWCKEVLENEDYWFDIINLIAFPINPIDGDNMITRSIIRNNIELLKDDKILTLISEKGIIFYDYFKKTDREKIDSYLDTKKKNETNLLDFLYSLSVEQNWFLYIFSKMYNIIKSGESRKKSYVFCFDNLDELDYKYLTSDLWKQIITLNTILDQIGEDLNLDFDFQKNLTFILVFREANLGCICAQRNDLQGKFIEQSRLIYPENGKDIILKRLEVYKELKKENDEILSVAEIILNSDPYFSTNRVLPLFNYDIRKLSEALITLKASSNNELLNFSVPLYKKLEKEYIYIQRGILYNCIIKYLSSECFFDKLTSKDKKDKEKPYANIKRMMLIVFSNLSYPTGFKSDKKELNQQKPEPFSIIRGFEPLMDIIDPEEYCTGINELLDLNSSSKTHLITVYGKYYQRSGDKYYFDFTEEVRILKRFQNNGGSLHKLSSKDQETISSVSISLNATAFIYLKYILSHFEYMSTCKVNGKNGVKALAQLNYINPNSKNWAFIEQIDRVYKTTDTQCNNIINFYKTKIKSKYPDIETFKNSPLTFKGGGWDGFYALHFFRTISCHITYIDVFRLYINRHFDEYIAPILETNSNIELNSKQAINDALLKYIKCYIDLHSLFDDDNDIQKVGEKLRKNYAEALNCPNVSITTDRNVPES